MIFIIIVWFLEFIAFVFLNPSIHHYFLFFSSFFFLPFRVSLFSGVVGELCGLAYGRRQDSSVQNDADVASAEAVESFGSLSGHEGKEQKY